MSFGVKGGPQSHCFAMTNVGQGVQPSPIAKLRPQADGVMPGGSRAEIASRSKTVAPAIAAPQCCGSVWGVKPRAPRRRRGQVGQHKRVQRAVMRHLPARLAGRLRPPAGTGAPVFLGSCAGVQTAQANGSASSRGK